MRRAGREGAARRRHRPGGRLSGAERLRLARPTSAAATRLLEERGLAPIAWSNAPFDAYAAHEHAYDKTLFCTAGSIRFDLGEPVRSIELRAGEGLFVPAGTRHSAIVGAEGCTCVEGHGVTASG